MTARGQISLAISLSALACGLSLGGRMFYLTALFGMLVLLFSFISVLLSRIRLRVHCRLSAARVPRGETTELTLSVSRRGLFPVYPLDITLEAGNDTLYLSTQPSFGKQQQLMLSLPAHHVGVQTVGVKEFQFFDMFGLFKARVRCPQSSYSQLMVLPRPFDVDPLRFLSSDDGRTLPNRMAEDLSSPEDTRAYRAGDPLKRIHWKISARKREFIVRKFETPAPPDTLVLLDCTLPGNAGDSEETRATLRDALCETALSVASMQARAGHPVRVPLYGKQAQEFYTNTTENIAHLKELLCLQPFMGGTEFERVLRMELRRMRSTGATAIVTSRLSAEVVEGVKHIRKMGPNARVYLVTQTPDAPQDRPYVAQLQQCMVEVCYVTPA